MRSGVINLDTNKV